MNELAEKTVLLIVGQPKAGTTSLFHWLSQHPEIGAGKLKELRFFLDPEYPLTAKRRFDGKALNGYLELFFNSDRNVILDATPDYMANDTPLTLPNIIPKAKAILIVRDSVERMISAYRYFQSRGLIPEDMSFDTYVEKQSIEGIGKNTPVQYRALDHCRTEYYLNKWKNAYGSNFKLVHFDDLAKNPEELLKEICEFIEIDSEYDFHISQENQTTSYKSKKAYMIYAGVRSRIARLTTSAPQIYKTLKPIGQIINKFLKSQKVVDASNQQKNDVEMLEATRLLIHQYQTKV